MENKPQKATNPSPVASPDELLGDIRRMIEEARSAVAITVNAGLTMLYWRIGKRIREEILREQRSAYGKQILATLSQELTRDYGKGFNYSALTRMVRFAEVFPDEQIVVTLLRQLSWSHFVVWGQHRQEGDGNKSRVRFILGSFSSFLPS